ncbi:MAG: hypothetical protein ACXWL2_00685 [Candidatus Chromulinivorax sp.]
MNRNFKIVSCLSLSMIYTFPLTALPADIVKSAIWITWSIATYQNIQAQTATKKETDTSENLVSNEQALINEQKMEGVRQDSFQEDLHSADNDLTKSDKAAENNKFLESIELAYHKELLNQKRHRYLDTMFIDAENDCL